MAGIALSTPAFAVVTIDYVHVGNAGNAADPATGGLYGAVAYEYRIGKYEVTNAQYTEFLNAVDSTGSNPNNIYNNGMGGGRGGITFTNGAANGAKYTIRSSMGDKPVIHVTWYAAARFTNWLHNGQGSGSTEIGAYTLTLNTGLITKNVGANVWIPSENEWYKAAYYDPTPGAGGGDNYWNHATQSNTVSVASANATGDVSNPGADVANFARGATWNSVSGNVTTVGSAEANNFFGTADQAGNVEEWNDAVIGLQRGFRGGDWASGNGNTTLSASFRSSREPEAPSDVIGFRVASIPEPSAYLLSVLSASALLIRRQRSSL